jgi:hypothetical protein
LGNRAWQRHDPPHHYPAAFEAIAATIPLGSVGYERAEGEGERHIWLALGVVNRLRARRGPGTGRLLQRFDVG